MKFLILFALSFLVLACSDKKPELTQNEKNYLQTRDSLVKYKAEVLEISATDTLAVTDFMRMDYASYKEKYNLSEKEIDILRRTLNVRCEQAKAFKLIEENLSRRIPKDAPSKDSVEGNDSFNQKLKPANLAKDDEEEVKILMDAFEKK